MAHRSRRIPTAWFNEWEFKGTPWTNREMYRKWSPHPNQRSA